MTSCASPIAFTPNLLAASVAVLGAGLLAEPLPAQSQKPGAIKWIQALGDPSRRSEAYGQLEQLRQSGRIQCKPAELIQAMRTAGRRAKGGFAPWQDRYFALVLTHPGFHRAGLPYVEELAKKWAHTPTARSSLLLRVAELRLLLGREAGATVAAKEALAVSRAAITAARTKIAAAATAGESAEAEVATQQRRLAILERVLPDLFKILGDIELSRGRFTLAAEHYATLRSLEPRDPDLGLGLLKQAELELAAGDSTLALARLVEFDEKTTQSPFRPIRDYLEGAALTQLAQDDPSQIKSAQEVLLPLRKSSAPPRGAVAALLADLALLSDNAAAAKSLLDDPALAADQTSTTVAADALALRAELAVRGRRSEEVAALLKQTQSRLDRLRDEWNREPPRPGGQGFLTYGNRRGLLRTLVSLVEAQGRGQEGLLECWTEVLACQRLCTRARLMPKGLPEKVSATELRNGPLTQHGGILLYVVSKRGSLVLGLDRQGAFSQPLPSYYGLRATRDALDALLTDATRRVPRGAREAYGGRLLDAARAYADDVLPQTIRQRVLSWQEATVCDYGLLDALPLEALAVEIDGRPRLLGEVLALSHTNCLELEHSRRQDALPTAAPAIRLNAADIDAIELRAWAKAHDPVAPVLDTLEASGGASFTHVVAHGTEIEGLEFYRALESGSPSASQPLGFHELLDRDWGGLVVLSVCSGGTGPMRQGDGSFHASLGGALLLGEAHTVIQSRAEILFDPHCALMAAFHQNLAAAKSTRIALQRARVGHESDSWFVRFQHAQLQVIGAGHLRPLAH